MLHTRPSSSSRVRLHQRSVGRSFANRMAVAVLATLPLLASCANSNDTNAPTTGSSVPSISAGSESGGESSAPGDLCSKEIQDKVKDVIAKPVTFSVGPTGDCEISQDDPRGLQGSFGTVENASTNGGYDTYLTGLEATMDQVSKVQVAGLGDQAVVFTGLPKMGSGENFMAGGVTDHGTYLLQVTLTQGKGMARPDLEAVAEGILRAIDTASS